MPPPELSVVESNFPVGSALIVVVWPAVLVETTGVTVVGVPSSMMLTQGDGASVVEAVVDEESARRTTFGVATICDTSRNRGMNDEMGAIMMGQR